ncbi:MAG: class I SAM-dependent methyltransferase, partial [Myxococcales bacterium]|nr:class I SAM-dependent methyltransferase [Myxococcales bacterium]
MAEQEIAPSSEADGSGVMFDRIAARYDRLNRILSLGMDRGWRRKLVESLAPEERNSPKPILDVATGTADVALAVARAYPDVAVVGL